MPLTRLSLMCCLSMTVAGCAIHPLPDDVTGYDTYEIVNKIRCEARDAVQHKAIALLARSSSAKTREIAKQLQDNTLSFKDMALSSLDPDTRFFVDKYSKTAIAYEFTFDITEDNEADAQVDFLGAFTRGGGGFGLKASNDRMRENTRHFQISDTFGKIVNEDLLCPKDGNDPNWLYPIAGSIGLAESVKIFLDLNESRT